MNEDEVKAVFQTAFDVPTMTQLQQRCNQSLWLKDKDGRDCTEFFADKDEHVAESGYGHRFPYIYL